MRNFTVIIISVFFYLTGIQAQITEIPDPIFEQYLIDFGYDTDLIVNGQMLTSDAVNISFLQINDTPPIYSISDFTGIQDFTSLDTFIFTFTEVETLDLSNLGNLTYVEGVSHSNLTNINIGGCDNLRDFILSGTSVANITLPSNASNLERFICGDALLTILDLSQYTSLNNIGVRDNLLEALNVNNNNNTDITNFDTSQNPNLTCILVDNIAYSQENWTSIDPVTEFVDDIEDCPGLLSVATPLLESGVTVFPNPATHFFQIDANIQVSALTVYDVSGKKVKEFVRSQDVYHIDDLSSGLYVMRIQTEGILRTCKLVIR